jgi:tetratricopeptide (TPR) repeat protein
MSKGPNKPSPRRVDRETAFRMAVQRQQAGAGAEAIRLYQQILAVDPSYAPAWINIGVALRALGRIDAGVACLQRGVSLKSDDAPALSNLGNALRAAGRLEEARNSHLTAIAIDPVAGSFVYNLGLVLRDLGEFDAAIERFDAAEAIGYAPAELKWDRALALLLRGDLERGFEAYEWRWQIPDAKPRSFEMPAWDGENIADKALLVHAEQGFGDTIQFVRYLPMLADRAGSVVFECQEPLVRLFGSSPACRDVTVVARAAAPPPEHDVHVALLSLAHLLGTDENSIPAPISYLKPPAETPRVARKGNDLRVGLVWAGKPSHRNDRNRSLPFSAMAPLLETAGVDFYSLQLGDPADTVSRNGYSALLTDLRPAIKDFGDSAALITSLDLIISADTAPAHLAGALGCPVWTLIPFAPDWRWMSVREDSPWYPSMTLFRQNHPRDWTDVVERLCTALKDKVAEQAAKRD